MQRRQFLQSAAVAAPALLAHSPVLGGAAESDDERRFGDLLLRRAASDRFEMRLTSSRPRPLRLLQLTDTHFHPGDDTDRATEKTLRRIVESARPDFIVHTGDFVNNDSDKQVDWTGLDVLNGLRLPWTLCFGNHDYPVHNAPGSLALDAIRERMERGFQGYVDSAGGRHYCYRYDVYAGDAPRPSASLCFFQVGYAQGDRRISPAQLEWFERQMQADAEREVDTPITVFVHIPLLEYRELYRAGRAVGQRGEDECHDNDTGDSFKSFAKSKRVVAVFCGHDHVNNYHGLWNNVDLVYGRVSGWGGYGPADWKRGGRLLEIDLAAPRPATRHQEVV